VQKDMKLLPFQIVDKGGKPQISVKVKGENKLMPPEDSKGAAANEGLFQR